MASIQEGANLRPSMDVEGRGGDMLDREQGTAELRPRRSSRWAAGVLVLGAVTAACGSTTNSSATNASATFPTSTGSAPSSPPATASYTPWPEAGHDPRHSGSSPAVGPTTGHVRWVRALGAPITGGPVVEADGKIVVATDAGVLHALDAATGADVWTFNAAAGYGSNDLSTSPAILPDGTILWPGPGNRLFAFDTAGHELWSQPFPAMVLSPAVASASKVYVVDVNGDVSSVMVGDAGAQLLWTVALGGGNGATFGSPAIGPDGTVYTTVGQQAVAVADKGSTGHVLWRFNMGAAIEVSPAVGPDGTVVVGSNNPYQYGLSAAGHLRWKLRRESETYSSTSVTSDGLAYYGDNNGVVYVANASTGEPVVRYQGLQGVWSIPIIDSAHHVYFGTQGGHIYGFTYQGARLFDINAQGPIDSYPAIAGDGTLIVGTKKGSLYAISS